MRKYINVCYVTLSGGNKIIVADFKFKTSRTSFLSCFSSASAKHTATTGAASGHNFQLFVTLSGTVIYLKGEFECSVSIFVRGRFIWSVQKF